MVAVSYGEAITRGLSMTFFVGVRRSSVTPRRPGATPLFASSRGSYARGPAGWRAQPARRLAGSAGHCRPRRGCCDVGGGSAAGATPAPPMRAVIVGDADFASNSFLPYLANGDLALAAVRWLAREEHSTAVASRIPVPPMILLSGTQMRGVFLAVAVLLPLGAFVLGAVAWWRGR
jgi:hypothetical protein